MKKYYRIMLGQKSAYSAECLAGNFIGVDFGINQDLTSSLSEDWRTFNKQFIPVFMAARPDKTKVAAGLACGFLWTVSMGLQDGDIVLCPDGQGRYNVGEVVGKYEYHSLTNLPHRRPVRWFNQKIDRADMGVELRNSTGSIGTVSNIDKYADEIEKLIGGAKPATIISTDATVEDPSVFALEKHLEDFLVANWSQTELGRDYEIFQEDGEIKGQQYPTDTGPIDILAISKDKSKLLVVELKKGRASDAVVGQIQRYMGFVKDELAEKDQIVEGIIIALDDDVRIRRALSVASGISFYKYQVSFKLLKT
jgi:restriction system protein